MASLYVGRIYTDWTLCAYLGAPFLTPKQIQNGLKKIYNWLEPGGMIYAVNHTPYIELFDYFINEFETKKENLEPWPGLISDLSSHPKYDFYQMPAWINLMDKDIFHRIFKEAGFSIKELEYLNASEIIPTHGVQYDGRELVGCVSVKKKHT